jgi:hypothetical protein
MTNGMSIRPSVSIPGNLQMKNVPMTQWQTECPAGHPSMFYCFIIWGCLFVAFYAEPLLANGLQADFWKNSTDFSV